MTTEYPVALNSPDHTHPLGCLADQYTNPAFIEELEGLFARKVSVLDLGCAGAGMVRDLLQQGHVAVGLEGSDRPQDSGFAAWPELGSVNLFTADIGKPFEVRLDGAPTQFDVVTAWDVFEHIPEDSLPQLMKNVVSHLTEGGLLIVTIANSSSCPDVEHHLTIRETQWWIDLISGYLEPSGIRIKNPVRTPWEVLVFKRR